MLLYLVHWLELYCPLLSIFHSIPCRTLISMLSALLFVLWTTPHFIRYASHHQLGQTIRDDGPQSHLKKSGTPSMGGLVMILAVTVSVLLWGQLDETYLLLLLFVMVGFAFIGFLDDYLKIVRRNARGLSVKLKFFSQSLIAGLAISVLYSISTALTQTQLNVPFLNIAPHLGTWYLILAYLMIVGSSNAVNLTDGLDGLALLLSVLVTMGLAVFVYCSSHVIFAHYFVIPYIPQLAEVIVFCAALVGAALGLLWYNTYPAQIFMGDVGSLSLGGVLGLLAVMVRQELVFLFMAGIFVVETASVILQVLGYRFTRKRLFLMAPLHHHFELKGWAETKIIGRFVIITIILVLLGLMTLILR